MKAERHENADMICAKANDMNLAVLAKCKTSDGWCWTEVEMESLSLHVGLDFFLCLPQHKEACLYWLNGGDVQAIHFENQMPDSGVMFDSDFVDVEGGIDMYPWKTNHIFMQEHEIEIKPKKEKRWIGTCKNFVTSLNYPSIDECKDAVGDDTSWQFHEIEVEV